MQLTNQNSAKPHSSFPSGSTDNAKIKECIDSLVAGETTSVNIEWFSRKLKGIVYLPSLVTKLFITVRLWLGVTITPTYETREAI